MFEVQLAFRYDAYRYDYVRNEREYVTYTDKTDQPTWIT